MEKEEIPQDIFPLNIQKKTSMSLIVILLKNVNGKAYFHDICMSEVLAPTRLCSSDTKKGRNHKCFADFSYSHVLLGCD